MKNLNKVITKKLLILSFFTFSFVQLNAQTVNGFQLEEIPAKYVEIVSTTKMFKAFQVTVYLDYGQIGKMKDIKKGHIIGDDGKSVSFNGTIGVLNALEKKGFKYLSQYVVSGASNASVYHTLLENTNFNGE
jgi:hypothetical protein|tara:strand:- start:313 stop:708 length:396 start_codon:yes stop_codon:yes gene_type:complete